MTDVQEASAKLASFQTLSADELSFHSAFLLMGHRTTCWCPPAWSCHHHLERPISIHTIDFQPSSIATVLHPENILVVGGRRQAGFNRSHIIVEERGRCVNEG